MKPWKCFWGAMLLCLLLLASCGEPNEVRTALNTADSLLADGQPDSAYSLLSSLPQPIMAKIPTKSLMRYELLKARAQNSAYIPFTSDSVMLRVADYYNRHGNANEQMTANYVLGCAYRDLGDAEQALECYLHAVETAESHAEECSFSILARIHGQIAELYLYKLMPMEQLEAQTKAERCDWKAGDTLSALIARENKARGYEMMYMTDSVIQIYENVISAYKRHGYMAQAYTAMIPLARNYLDKDETQKAGALIQILDNAGVDRTNFYYNEVRGRYFLKTGQLERSDTCFRNQLAASMTANDTLSSLLGLLDLFKTKGNRDSSLTYAEQCLKYESRAFAESSEANLNKLKSVYDYSLQQKKAKEQEKKAGNMRVVSLFVAFLLLLTVIISVYEIRRVKQKKEQETARLKKEYQDVREKLSQSLADLESVRAEGTASFEDRKENEIQQLQKQLQELATKHPSLLNERLLKSPVVKKMKKYAANPLSPSAESPEWKMLEGLMDYEMPSFGKELHIKYPAMSEEEFRLCILVRLSFTPSEISSLLEKKPSHVSMMRRRMLKKMYGMNGSPAEFDKRIRLLI